jgi:hypothetical protein
MEAFEHIGKIYLETLGNTVSTNVKFNVKKKTNKQRYDEYQEHGYEIDLVASKHNSLQLVSVKSFFGSAGVDRQGFKGLADETKKTHYGLYKIFNDETIREGILKKASEKYGYPKDLITVSLFVGKFKKADEFDITKHLNGIIAGAGPIQVVTLEKIVNQLLGAAKSKTYINDPVIMTVKVLSTTGNIHQASL